jgi:DNA-binding NtrC family response regulator
MSDNPIIAHRIAIVDDEPVTLKQIRRILDRKGYRVSAFSSAQRALGHLERTACDLVISDIKMPGMSGYDLMVKVRRNNPSIEFILITGMASIEGAIESTKEGAFHYLAKPFTPDQLRQTVEQALTYRRAATEAFQAAAEASVSKRPVIIGKSAKIRQVLTQIHQIAPADCNVMITGASGTGKELVARSIHELSDRAHGPFVAFNCGALTETLIDNELFGHEKGAYTGAEEGSPGLIEVANGGTLFLDEIGEIPHAMQVKLLRVLQEKELLRVGGRHPIALNVRVITATAKDPKTAVADGSLRTDFLFRINVFHIELPLLSEHREDIPLLAYHILNRLKTRGSKPISAITQNAMTLLTHYAYPGNVRELENILERAVAVCSGQMIRVSDLPADLSEFELLAYHRPEGQLMTLEALEQDYISHVLRLTDGVRNRAAEILGIDRASLWRKIKKFGLE